MSYQNPKIPEGINVTDEHPLKDFFIMLGGIGLGVMAVISLLIFLAEYLVRFIPFEVEQQLANHFQTELMTDNANSTQHQQYLQNLADKLAIAQQIPQPVKIIIHYIDSDEVNAFATLGGHVFVFQGLLSKMQSENALSMVLAHEIAHIKHRDPIIAMGRGITVGIAALSLAGAGDSSIAQQIIGQLSLLTTLKFNRNMEQEADAEALMTLSRYYGHTGAADTIFSLFLEEQSGSKTPELFSTHPLNEDRINAVKLFQSKGRSYNDNQLKSLPEWLTKPSEFE